MQVVQQGVAWHVFPGIELIGRSIVRRPCPYAHGETRLWLPALRHFMVETQEFVLVICGAGVRSYHIQGVDTFERFKQGW